MDNQETKMPENTKTIYITYDEKKPGEGPGRDYAKGAAPDAQQSRVYRCDF